MRLAIGTGTLALAMLASAQAAEIRFANVGNWRVGSYTNDQTGQFSHCAASAPYRSGIRLLFSVHEGFTWTMGFSAPDWNFRVGNQIQVTYSVDNFPAQSGIAQVLQPALVAVSLPNSAALFQQMRVGQTLTVVAEGKPVQFRLTATSVVLRALLDCAGTRGASLAAPIAPPSPPVPSQSPSTTLATRAVPPAAPAAPPVPDRSAEAAERRLEATQFVANMLAQSEMRGYRLLTATETRSADVPRILRDADVTWRGSSGVSALRVRSLRDPADIDRHASELIAISARECTGEFITARLSDPELRNVRRLMTFCGGSDDALATNYLLLPMPGGLMYEFVTIARGGREAATADDTRLRDAVHLIVTQHPAVGPTPAPRTTRG